jgi:hypothetical protein
VTRFATYTGKNGVRIVNQAKSHDHKSDVVSSQVAKRTRGSLLVNNVMLTGDGPEESSIAVSIPVCSNRIRFIRGW